MDRVPVESLSAPLCGHVLLLQIGCKPASIPGDREGPTREGALPPVFSPLCV